MTPKTKKALDIDEIEARAKAVPGPLAFTYDGSGAWSVGPERDPQLEPVATAWSQEAAALLCHAREDVPTLCAEIRRLKKAMVAALDAAREGFPLPADSWIRILTHALGDDAPKWPEPGSKP